MSRAPAVTVACACGVLLQVQLDPGAAEKARSSWQSFIQVFKALAPERLAQMVAFHEQHEALGHQPTMGMAFVELDPDSPVPPPIRVRPEEPT